MASSRSSGARNPHTLASVAHRSSSSRSAGSLASGCQAEARPMLTRVPFSARRCRPESLDSDGGSAVRLEQVWRGGPVKGSCFLLTRAGQGHPNLQQATPPARSAQHLQLLRSRQARSLSRVMVAGTAVTPEGGGCKSACSQPRGRQVGHNGARVVQSCFSDGFCRTPSYPMEPNIRCNRRSALPSS